ncbi:MAG: permease [Gammaproteobacteria bacterium]|nr:permease [Gammaproteobacteria bacterium]|tara:strand:- start:4368 stop:5075 length:708 start_codon:yes stop_codon:yes gene_type:complete
MDFMIAVLIICIGSYVQTSIGFGLAIIAAPILFLLNPDFVPAPVTVSALTLSLAIAISHRHHISFKGLKFAILGRIPGTVAGGVLLLWVDQRALALWLGISVILAVVLTLRNVVLQPTPRALFSAGFLSGFMGTSTSIGGPPMALVLQHQENSFIRANLAAFFVISCCMTLLMLMAVDRFGVQEVRLALPLMPATLLGYWLAMKTLHLISHQILRRASLILCSFAGLAAIVSYWI